MPRLHQERPERFEDARIELVLEPGQRVDLPPLMPYHLGLERAGNELVQRAGHHRYIPITNYTLTIVRLAISNPDIEVEAAVDRDMITVERWCGPWMGGTGQEGELLIVPVRMAFIMSALNRTKETQRVTIWMRLRIRDDW